MVTIERKMEPHPGTAPGNNGFADRGVLLLARAATRSKGNVRGRSRTRISAFAGPRPICWTTRTSMKWYPRQDSHSQPSRSKRGALVIELRGHKKNGRRRSCSPDPAMGPLGFRDRSGALVRFTIHGKIGSFGWTRTNTFPLNRRACSFDTTNESQNKWPLEPGSHRPIRGFSAALISLSHPAEKHGFAGNRTLFAGLKAPC